MPISGHSERYCVLHANIKQRINYHLEIIKKWKSYVYVLIQTYIWSINLMLHYTH